MKKILIYIIRFYQRNISPYKTTKCPYYPCCSQYGLESIQRHGALIGTFLAVWRILRCNPFSKGGYDPVIEKKLFPINNRKKRGQYWNY